MKKLATGISVLVLSAISLASSLPTNGLIQVITNPASTSSTNYWTKPNIALIALDALAKSADEAFTMRNAGRTDFQEHDPLARPFVMHGRAIAGASEGLLFAGEVFTSYELHKHGHPRLAKTLLLFGIAGNTMGVATSDR